MAPSLATPLISRSFTGLSLSASSKAASLHIRQDTTSCGADLNRYLIEQRRVFQAALVAYILFWVRVSVLSEARTQLRVSTDGGEVLDEDLALGHVACDQEQRDRKWE